MAEESLVYAALGLSGASGLGLALFWYRIGRNIGVVSSQSETATEQAKEADEKANTALQKSEAATNRADSATRMAEHAVADASLVSSRLAEIRLEMTTMLTNYVTEKQLAASEARVTDALGALRSDLRDGLRSVNDDIRGTHMRLDKIIQNAKGDA